MVSLVFLVKTFGVFRRNPPGFTILALTRAYGAIGYSYECRQALVNDQFYAQCLFNLTILLHCLQLEECTAEQGCHANGRGLGRKRWPLESP